MLLNFPLDLSPVALWRRVYELRNQSEFFATRFAKIDKKKDKVCTDAAKQVMTDLPKWDTNPSCPTVDYYYWYYGTLAMFQLDARELAKLFRELRAQGVTDLSAYLGRNPDFLHRAMDALVVNETAYAAGWREIAAEARGFEAARRREPIEWRVRPRS